MKCIVCGKKLRGNRYKYCSSKCAQKGYKQGKAMRIVDKSVAVRDLYEDFKKSFLVGTSYHCKDGGTKIRTFVCACLSLGYSITSIAKGIGRDHSTISHHKYNITEDEKRLAKTFLEHKDYVYGSKYNGFSYRSVK